MKLKTILELSLLMATLSSAVQLGRKYGRMEGAMYTMLSLNDDKKEEANGEQNSTYSG